ncbi:MAG: hypothetical protein IJI60_02000 [Bacilli bacterium]|nr:hypothetical protein [Bacilli bacterium]
MIDSKNLKLTPYELLKKANGKAFKGVGVITDYQSVFYSKSDGYLRTHYGMVSEVEKEIYSSLNDAQITEMENKDAHIFLTEYEAIVSFPDNVRISLPQVYFILEFVQSITRYNREVDSKSRIPIHMDWYGKPKTIYDIQEIDEKKVKEWSRYIRQTGDFSHERIVGKRYSQKEVNESYFRKR